MTDREKLYELIDGVDIMAIPTENFRHSLADYLISHGVVVREKGEWVNRKGAFWTSAQCSSCGERQLVSDEGMNFCPNCGADMRKEKHED